MPRLVKDPKGGDAWELVPGAPPMPIGLVTSAGRGASGTKSSSGTARRTTTSAPARSTARTVVEDQDIDGVAAEVLYPSQRTMGTFMAQPDDDYHLAGIDAYNQWMHDEFMAVDPTRLDRAVPDAGHRHRRVGREAARGEEPRLPRRDPLGVPEWELRSSPTTTTRSGRRPKKKACRCTSTSV